jgi:hypothetical protein
MLAEENMRRGMPAPEAARAARVALGGLTQIREAHRGRADCPRLKCRCRIFATPSAHSAGIRYSP